MVLAILMVVTYPIYLLVFFIKNFKNLNCETTFEKYEVLYEGLKNVEFSALMFYIFYIVRRLLFVVIAIFSAEIPVVQLFIMTQSSLLLLIYLILYKPFMRILDLGLEIFNEATILIHCYHLFMFTDYMQNSDIQYSGGTSMIVITLLNIIFNTGIMFWQTGKEIKKAFKNIYDRCKRKQMKNKERMNQVIPLATSTNLTNLENITLQKSTENSYEANEFQNRNNNIYGLQRRMVRKTENQSIESLHVDDIDSFSGETYKQLSKVPAKT